MSNFGGHSDSAFLAHDTLDKNLQDLSKSQPKKMPTTPQPKISMPVVIFFWMNPRHGFMVIIEYMLW